MRLQIFVFLAFLAVVSAHPVEQEKVTVEVVHSSKKAPETEHSCTADEVGHTHEGENNAAAPEAVKVTVTPGAEAEKPVEKPAEPTETKPPTDVKQLLGVDAGVSGDAVEAHRAVRQFGGFGGFGGGYPGYGGGFGRYPGYGGGGFGGHGRYGGYGGYGGGHGRYPGYGGGGFGGGYPGYGGFYG